MSNTFLVEGTFEISGRGLVIAGQVLDGTIKVGGNVMLQDGFGGKSLACITGVEMGDGRNDDGKLRGFVGLLIGDLQKSQVSGIRNHLKSGDILTVLDHMPNNRF